MPADPGNQKSAVNGSSPAAKKGEKKNNLSRSEEIISGGASDSGSKYSQHPLWLNLDDTWLTRSRMPRTPSWTIVWSDLMMTMFIFFVVLYVYSVAQKQFLGPAAWVEATFQVRTRFTRRFFEGA